jgi:hypothetical protein
VNAPILRLRDTHVPDVVEFAPEAEPERYDDTQDPPRSRLCGACRT